MNPKSLSPRNKPSLKRQKIVIKKLTSLKKLSSARQESKNNFNFQESVRNVGNTHLKSKLQTSATKLNLKLEFKPPVLSSTTTTKLKAIAERFSPVKTCKIFPNMPNESLLPMSSQEAVSIFDFCLSKYELNEMLEYETIYYLGLKANKIRPNEKLKNKGFDEKDTSYILTTGDHLGYRYEILESIGTGSFSTVCKCIDHKTASEVAVKVIKSHERFQEQGEVELKILSYVKGIDTGFPSSFVVMLDNFTFRNHLCIVFELLSYNLYDLLTAYSFKGFSTTLVRRFIIQVVKGLRLLKKNNIIHCDLKPENLVLIHNQESLIKIIDFGSSCFDNEKLYFYIQSRIYRAPEIMLGISYSPAIDMWSLGCMVSELLTGEPLFQGESESDQLYLIMEVLGYPPDSIFKQATRKSRFFNPDGSVKNTMNSKGKIRIPNSKSLEEKSKIEDPSCIDFIKKCLKWVPEERITPKQALEHPWLLDLHRKLRPMPAKSPRRKIL